MAPFLNAKGQPVKMSFLDLFVPRTPTRGSKRATSLEAKTKQQSSSTEASPQSTAATEAPTESPKTTESGSAEWTRVEEMAILGMKAQNMTWKEIDEALPGKDLEAIKKKYKELYADAPANVKPKEADGKKEEAKKEEEKTEEKKEEAKDESKATEGGKQGRKYQKGQKGQKGKGAAEETKPGEVKTGEAKPEETKGILKVRATAEEKGKGIELKSIYGHPVIFVDDDEELDYDELLYLYGLNARYDEVKWINVDSKFFDRFGKRVGAEKLKEKLASTW